MEAVYTAAFASGNYMVRSGRRKPVEEPPAPEPRPPRKPGQKKERPHRKEAGFIYKSITVFAGIIIWPVGLVLLLRRYLKWKPYSKFLAACITLACSIFLYGFLLTVNTGNPTYTQLQDSINSRIEVFADEAVRFSSVIDARLTEVKDGADNLFRAVMDVAGNPVADLIDSGVELSRSVRAQIDDWTGITEARNAATPEPTSEPVSTPTPAPVQIAERAVVNADTILLPVYMPSQAADPKLGTDLFSGKLTRSGIIPNATPVPDIGIDEEIVRSYLVKTADSIPVFFNPGSGHYYHTSSSCGSMKTAEQHTLREAADSGFEACSRCKPTPLSVLDIQYIVWIDEQSVVHLTDQCEASNGKSTISSADEALQKDLPGCSECGSDAYLDAIKSGTEISIVSSEQFY